MVESFKEIQAFFRKKEFSQEELANLKENLLSTYGKEKSTLNAINSSINLNLIHYKITGPVKTPPEKTKPPRPRKISKPEKTKPPRPRKISKEEREKRKLEEFDSKLINFFIKNTINKPLTKAAIYVEMEIEDFINKLRLPIGSKKENLKVFDHDLWLHNERWIKRKLNYNRKIQLTGKGEITPEIFYNNAKGKSLDEVAGILDFTTPQFIKLCHLSNDNKTPPLFSDKLWEKNKKWIKQRLQKLSKENLRNSPTGIIKRSNNSKRVASGVYGELVKAKTIKSIIYTRM